MFYSGSVRAAQCGGAVQCDLWTYTIDSAVADLW